jgi:hypothetical protein
MKPTSWIRKVLVDLFDSQLGAARQLHFGDRTVRYWVQHGAPPHIERSLRRLKAGKISLRQARRIMHEQRERRANREPASDVRDSRSNNLAADLQALSSPPADHNKDASAPDHPMS